MKHTPGPWTFISKMETAVDSEDKDFIFEHCTVVGSNGKLVFCDDYGDKKGDLILAAAAPDMLEALEFFKAYFADDPKHVEFFKKTSEIIAKAKGEK